MAGSGTGQVTIAASASLSGALDLGDSRLKAVQMPSAWTAALLSFQVSADGVTYGVLKDTDGTEIQLSVDVNQCVNVYAPDFAPWRFVKVQSGLSSGAVTQTAARTLTLVAGR